MSNEIAKCYEYVLPLLKENAIDSCDAFMLGHLLTKYGEERFESALKLIAKVQSLKKGNFIEQIHLNLVYEIILQGNIEQVLRKLNF